MLIKRLRIRSYSLKNFKVSAYVLKELLHDIYCLVINVHFALLLLVRVSFVRLSRLAKFVNNFFYFFQNLFSKFFRSDFERRKRDLNPRAAINDLLPFQGSPFSLLGISPFFFTTSFHRKTTSSVVLISSLKL